MCFFSQVKKINSVTEKLEKSKYDVVNRMLIEDKDEFDSFALQYCNYLFYSSSGNPSKNVDSSYKYILNSEKELMYNSTKEEYTAYCNELNLCYATLDTKEKAVIKEAYSTYCLSLNKDSLEYFDTHFGKNEFSEIVFKELETINYNLATQKKSVNELRDFLLKYPNSPRYKKDIESQIEKLTFELLLLDFTIDGYLSFIKEFPNSKNKVELRVKYS